MTELTQPVFAENVNTTFQLRLDDGKTVELCLTEVSEMREKGPQKIFSIIFRGAKDSLLGQGLYTLEHERMGSFEIFLVPVGQDEQGYDYEALFNRLTNKSAR